MKQMSTWHSGRPGKGCRVGLRIVLFEACSAFTHVAACTLALSPIRDTLSEGFSYFVTSIAAPVASGWSVRRVGLAPTGKRRLVTAHTRSGHWGHGGLNCVGFCGRGHLVAYLAAAIYGLLEQTRRLGVLDKFADIGEPCRMALRHYHRRKIGSKVALNHTRP